MSLDLGGHNFRSLEELPHVGAVIYADEEAYEERLQRLLEKLDRLADERAELLGEAAANSLWEYNARNPEQALPAVLVVIDNFADLHENYEGLVEATIMPLVRRSLSAGISFVVSANARTTCPAGSMRCSASASPSSRATPIVTWTSWAAARIEIDDIPGRGYIRIGKRRSLFQAALPVGILAPGWSRSVGGGRRSSSGSARICRRTHRRWRR